MAWQRRAGTHSLQNKAAAGEHSWQTMRPAQALKQNNSQQMAGLAAKQWPQTTLAGLSPCSAGWWRECGGAGHSERRAQTYPTCLPPTYRLCLSLSIPTPLIYKTQFSPNLFLGFFLFPPFTSPLKIRPLTPFIVSVRLTYRSPSLLPTPTFPSRRGIREG